MIEEKVGQFIKDLRKREGLTQDEFAKKFGVTYQAVSKWENNKSIPDITILKAICKEYDLDLNNLLDGERNNKKSNLKIILSVCSLIIVVLGTLLFIIYKNMNSDFELRSLHTSSSDFKVFGTIAYNDNKTTIYISDITYEGDINNDDFEEIKCSLYENENGNNKLISSYDYNDSKITLQEFLKQVKFNINHYSNSCKMYEKDALHLEIEAINSNNKRTYYKIPLVSEIVCDN